MCNTILLHAKWGLVYSNAFLILFTFKPSTCIRSRFVHVILMTAKQKVKANKWFERDIYYGVNCYQPALISSRFLQGIYWESFPIKFLRTRQGTSMPVLKWGRNRIGLQFGNGSLLKLSRPTNCFTGKQLKMECHMLMHMSQSEMECKTSQPTAARQQLTLTLTNSKSRVTLASSQDCWVTAKMIKTLIA